MNLFEKFPEILPERLAVMFRPKAEIEDFVYDKNFLFLGKNKYTSKMVGIDSRDGVRVLMLGVPGSGKTFLLRSFMDRADQ